MNLSIRFRMGYAKRIIRIYRKNFALFFLFRLLKSIVMFGYRWGYRSFCLIVQHPESGTYDWRALSTVGVDICSEKRSILQGSTVEVSSPRFFGVAADTLAEAYKAQTIYGPEQSIYEFSQAVAIGGIDAIIASKQAIHHDLFQPSEHHCPAENTGVLLQELDGKRLHLYLLKNTLSVHRAASLIGQCSSNYAHWLTEILPKLLILDLSAEHAEWPLLIDANLHPNILASIELLNKNRRKIIQVERWQPVRLNQLRVVSAPGYERYVPQNLYATEPTAYRNVFSYEALELLRTSVAEAVRATGRPGAGRVYLARSSKSGNLRRLKNAVEIEEILRGHHIVPIFPESVSFQQQVKACLNAELIVAPIGAALANMIFAPRGCKVVVLAPYYDRANYHFFTNLAGVLGHKLSIVLGTQSGSIKQPSQKCYSIELEDLLEALTQNI